MWATRIGMAWWRHVFNVPDFRSHGTLQACRDSLSVYHSALGGGIDECRLAKGEPAAHPSREGMLVFLRRFAGGQHVPNPLVSRSAPGRKTFLDARLARFADDN